MKIDAHQHFWRYSAAEYGWIDDAMSAIRRDFLPADLASVLTAENIDGSVAVQARQSLVETDWLLELASASPVIKGVVGWLPLALNGKQSAALLDHYQSNSRFKGVRHVLQAEPDSYFANTGFNDALHELSDRNLTYDLLIFARQLPAAIAWVDRHPSLRIVLDHIAKPVVDGSPSANGGPASVNWPVARTFIAKFPAWSPKCRAGVGPLNCFDLISRWRWRRSVRIG